MQITFKIRVRASFCGVPEAGLREKDGEGGWNGLRGFRETSSCPGARARCTAQTTVESAASFKQRVQKLLKHSCNETILSKKPQNKPPKKKPKQKNHPKEQWAMPRTYHAKDLVFLSSLGNSLDLSSFMLALMNKCISSLLSFFWCCTYVSHIGTLCKHWSLPQVWALCRYLSVEATLQSCGGIMASGGSLYPVPIPSIRLQSQSVPWSGGVWGDMKCE